MTHDEFQQLKDLNNRVKDILAIQVANSTRWTLVHTLIFSKDIAGKVGELYLIRFNSELNDEYRVKSYADSLDEAVNDLYPYFESEK